jgi:hypothetical protein
VLEGQSRHYGHEGNSVLSRGEKRWGDSVLERGHTVTPAEASGHDGDLGLALLRGPQGTVINTKVLWAVKDGSALLGECDGRHEGK